MNIYNYYGKKLIAELINKGQKLKVENFGDIDITNCLDNSGLAECSNSKAKKYLNLEKSNTIFIEYGDDYYLIKNEFARRINIQYENSYSLLDRCYATTLYGSTIKNIYFIPAKSIGKINGLEIYESIFSMNCPIRSFISTNEEAIRKNLIKQRKKIEIFEKRCSEIAEHLSENFEVDYIEQDLNVYSRLFYIKKQMKITCPIIILGDIMITNTITGIQTLGKDFYLCLRPPTEFFLDKDISICGNNYTIGRFSLDYFEECASFYHPHISISSGFKGDSFSFCTNSRHVLTAPMLEVSEYIRTGKFFTCTDFEEVVFNAKMAVYQTINYLEEESSIGVPYRYIKSLFMQKLYKISHILKFEPLQAPDNFDLVDAEKYDVLFDVFISEYKENGYTEDEFGQFYIDLKTFENFCKNNMEEFIVINSSGSQNIANSGDFSLERHITEDEREIEDEYTELALDSQEFRKINISNIKEYNNDILFHSSQRNIKTIYAKSSVIFVRILDTVLTKDDVLSIIDSIKTMQYDPKLKLIFNYKLNQLKNDNYERTAIKEILASIDI